MELIDTHPGEAKLPPDWQTIVPVVLSASVSLQLATLLRTPRRHSRNGLLSWVSISLAT